MLRNNKVLSGSFLCSIAAIAPGPGAELFHSANILRVNDTPSPETREKKLFKKLPLQDELLQREGRHHRLRAGREELGHDIRIGREPGRVVSLDLLFSFSEKRFFCSALAKSLSSYNEPSQRKEQKRILLF